MLDRARTTLGILFLAVALPGVALAQERSPAASGLRERLAAPVGAERGRPDHLFELTLDGILYGEADGGPIEVSTARFGADLGTRVPLGENLFLTPGLGFEHSRYEFDGLAEALPGAGDGPEGLHGLSLDLGVLHTPPGELGYFGVVTASVSGESGADLGDAFTWGVAGGVRWSPSEEIAIRLGAGFFSRLEDDPLAIPALGLRWTPADAWTVNVGFPRTRVEYAASDDLTLFLGGEFDFQDFRLEGRGPTEDGVLRDDAIGVALGAGYRLSPSAILEISAGTTVYREVTFDDDSGDELLEEDLDGTAFLKLSVTLRF